MKAMILAAGVGERMRPLTDHTPKPLLRAGGMPLIEHLIVRMAGAGLRQIVVNVSHLGEQIEAYCGNGDTFAGRCTVPGGERRCLDRLSLRTSGGKRPAAQ